LKFNITNTTITSVVVVVVVEVVSWEFFNPSEEDDLINTQKLT